MRQISLSLSPCLGLSLNRGKRSNCHSRYFSSGDSFKSSFDLFFFLSFRFLAVSGAETEPPSLLFQFQFAFVDSGDSFKSTFGLFFFVFLVSSGDSFRSNSKLFFSVVVSIGEGEEGEDSSGSLFKSSSSSSASFLIVLVSVAICGGSDAGALGTGTSAGGISAGRGCLANTNDSMAAVDRRASAASSSSLIPIFFFLRPLPGPYSRSSFAFW